MKRDKNIIVWRKKNIANEIAATCELPRDFALKVVEIILEYLKMRIKKDKRIVIPQWGIFRISRFGLPRFRPAPELRRYVEQKPDWDRMEHGRINAVKIRRLEAKGPDKTEHDEMQLRHLKYALWAYLRHHPGVTQWLREHEYIPREVEVELKRWYKRKKELENG